jgi:hypothetical protein
MAVARIAWSKEQIADCDVAKTGERFATKSCSMSPYLVRVSDLLSIVRRLAPYPHRNDVRNLVSRPQPRVASSCLLYNRISATQAKCTPDLC